MYQIVVCDDEIRELEKLRHDLNVWERQHSDCHLEIETFTDAKKLMALFRDEQYDPDLLLLDVYMQEETGIRVAKEFRRMGKEGAIVCL